MDLARAFLGHQLMLTKAQRQELLGLVLNEYLDLPAACSATGIRIQDIPSDLMAELVEAYNSVTSLIEGNLLRQILAQDDPADARWLAQQVERRRQAQTRMPQADGASVSQLLSKFSGDALVVLEQLILGNEDPLADLIEARVQALVNQGVVEERIKRKLERPLRRTRRPAPHYRVEPEQPAPPDNVVPIPARSYRWPPSPHLG